MPEQSYQDKTEPATPKRRGEIRREGRVPKSMEIPSAAVLMAGVVIIYMVGGSFIEQIETVMKSYLSLSYGSELTQGSAASIFDAVVFRFAIMIAPVILTIMFVGVGSNVAQFGFVFTFKPIMPKASTLNPLNGIKKIGFSSHSMIELSKSILKMSLVGILGYLTVKDLILNSVKLVDSSPAAIFSYMGESAYSVTVKISAAFLVLAAIDFFVQKRKFNRDTRMTKQEVKEEQKQEEGNPQIKGRMRREMIKRHRLRMMHAVPKADVVVTNPTHYAVAVKYDSQVMSAPKVVAKGKDLIAQRIKKIAAENNVPIENP
ncbi:MAG: EscU/YscU/HrcU family type III secretion system export apparatus switch protein, partial [Bacteroidetes bacterium]|nr:EscU/YscU/HrcU family type III secretion system export apparatus switch protein [Bacteroidota bacterium]